MGPALAVLLCGTAAAFPVVGPDPGWPAAGVTVATVTYSRNSVATLPDGHGGILLAWQDARGIDPASCNCRNMDDLYAQRLDPDGRKRWGDADLAVCKWRGMWGGTDLLTGFHPDGSGGAILVWMHADGPKGVYGQRVDIDGSLRWGPEGATVFDSGLGLKFTGHGPRTGRDAWIALDGDDEGRIRLSSCPLATVPLRCTPPFEVLLPAQFTMVSVLPGSRADSCLVLMTSRSESGTGACLAVPVRGRKAGEPRVVMESPEGVNARFLPDGEGGAWVVATVKAEKRLPWEILVQRVDEKGNPAWPAAVSAGLVASAGTPVAAAARPRGEAVVAWTDEGDPARVAVMGITRDGRRRWRAPARVANRAERTRPLSVIPHGEDWIVAWTEWEDGSVESLRASLIGADGGTPSPPEGFPVIRRNGAVYVERLDPTPGGAFVFGYDMTARALIACRVSVR